MQLRIKLLIIVFLCAFYRAHGQSIFKTLPRDDVNRSVIFDTVHVVPDRNLFRLVVNVGSYTVPDNSLLNGFGLSFQHVKWDGKTKRWYVAWSANVLVWDKASLKGNPNTVAFGLAFGVWNNRVLVGVGYGGRKTFATMGPGINFNN